MVKKTSTQHRGKRQNQPKVHKKIELVNLERPSSREEQQKRLIQEDKTLANTSIIVARPKKATQAPVIYSKSNIALSGVPQRASQQAYQRKPSPLIATEDYKYIKHDLLTIGILTSIMVMVMAILSFVIGID